ncbi:MAG: tyrosine-protein phosphatase [Propionibacteriaceae bacterium]|nr:tyrosine-protein phosphatase [Propionibacteriaceae bacterium]
MIHWQASRLARVVGGLTAALVAALLFGGCGVGTFLRAAGALPAGADGVTQAANQPATTPSASATSDPGPGTASPTDHSAQSPAPSAALDPVASVTPASTEAAETPKLTSIWNFRDVAGSGLPLADGGRMATGVVYRSGKLDTLSDKDKRALIGLGLVEVIDLRTRAKAASAPDPSLPGVANERIDIWLGRASEPTAKTVAQAEELMRDRNRDFVRVASQREKIAEALRAVLAADGPVLIHCTEGKDRTGWVSFLLQQIAGASLDDSVQQYLLSNDYRRALIEKEVAKVRKAKGETQAAIESATLELDSSYLLAGVDQAEQDYGGVDAYLTDGLGLTSDEISALAAKLRR